MPHSRAPNDKLYVIGIGASAGGLEAITSLIGPLKPDLPCAYVVLQHLSPSYRSMMVEILSRETVLKVKEAKQGDVPEMGTIYVVPSNYNAILKEGQLTLIPAPPEVVPKPSINQFFFSLAVEEGEAAIGVVLSGTGSDGTAGLRAIQAAGGFAFAQRPETAKYDGMPLAAIDAGVADHILAPEEIASQLYQMLSNQISAQEDIVPPADVFERLLNKLHEKLQLDFSGYKIGTLMRRIRRRQIATSKLDLASYLSFIEANNQELDVLARDILISVTAFFRDRDSFDALETVIQTLCNTKPPGSEIRVWVAGCASGEEAYSVAILLAEALGEKLPQYRLQVFATDIDDNALNVARRGVYPAASMAEVPEELLNRYFLPINNTYEVSKLLRDMIVFARHNLVSDPPFLRLDLVSCRNVLIYFDALLQARVFHCFHFGLNKDAHLFLGRSESVAQAESLFVSLDRRQRLFRKSGDATPILPGINPSLQRTMPQRRDRKIQVLLSGLVDHFGLTAVLCDVEGNILHSVGDVDRYLQFPVGTARLTISDATVAEFRGELLTLLHQCRQNAKPQRGRRHTLDKDSWRIVIEPLTDANSQMLLVLFVPEKSQRHEAEEPRALPDRVLEDELVATREHLQTLVEEMATANEEMQALNEEAQASNEELQATNEELEAANEEMQATNEELISLNEELNAKTLELSRLSEEYAHLYDTLDFPILVFDRALQMSRFNAAAGRRFGLRQTALCQPVSSLRLPNALHDLEQSLKELLANAQPINRCIVVEDKNLHLSINPGFDQTGHIRNLIVTLIDITEITRAQADLQESQSRLTALMENTTTIFAMKDIRGDYLYANPRFLEFFAIDANGYIGKNDFTLLPHGLATSFWGDNIESMRRRDRVIREHCVELGDSLYHLRTVSQLLSDSFGHPSAFIVEAEDITASKQAEQQLRITARVFDQAGEAIVITDPQSVIQTVNSAFTQITGYASHEAIGKRVGKLLGSGRHSKEFYDQLWDALKKGGHWQGEIWNRRKDGQIYPEWLTINRIENTDNQPEHYVAIFSDISNLKDTQRKVEFLATHDPLTGLPNRTLFQDHLRHAISRVRRENSRLALLFIDLDNFKTINDTLGHDVGDDLLCMAAERLRQAVRDVDTVARLGGDEFTAILMDCNEEAAEQVANRLVDDLSISYEINGRTLFISATIGIAFYPDDSQDSIGLLKAADTAMYRAKEEGRNRILFFRPDLHTKLLKQKALENGLREALSKNRLRLVYQPKFVLNGQTSLVGAEVLLRWHDPELGIISPGEFIPVAELSGLILAVSDYLLDSLLSQILAWREQGIDVPPLAINLSPKCVRESDYAWKIIEALNSKAIGSDLLQVEITENALLENNGTVLNNLQAINEVGIKISIDDFGTGYSSLSYLKRLPLNALKIDKSFVDGLGSDPEDEAIAYAILNLAKALNLETVAEGVETHQQLDWLKQHDCDQVQGYLLSRPLEVVDFTDLLKRQIS